MDYPALRRQAALRAVRAAGADGLLVTHPPNVRYLTGFTGSSAALVLGPKQTLLVTDGRYETQVARECPGLKVHVRTPDQSTDAVAAGLLGKLGVKNAAVEGAHVAVVQFELMRQHGGTTNYLADAGSVERLRAVKDAGEVEAIREAARVAERAFAMFLPTLTPDDTEKEMADALDGYLRRAGATCASFPVIVAAGDNGALPHARPGTDRRLGECSKLLVDWGADLGYKSDITRTFRSPFPPAPNRRNKDERAKYHYDEVFAAVGAAHDAAVAALHPGATCGEVDAAARNHLASVKLRDRGADGPPDLGAAFGHGLGHGVGLDIHELPRLRPGATDVLEAGMVVTIEPGVYLDGWGGVRLEDDYLVTRDGAVRLTTLPREISAL